MGCTIAKNNVVLPVDVEKKQNGLKAITPRSSNGSHTMRESLTRRLQFRPPETTNGNMDAAVTNRITSTVRWDNADFPESEKSERPAESPNAKMTPFRRLSFVLRDIHAAKCLSQDDKDLLLGQDPKIINSGSSDIGDIGNIFDEMFSSYQETIDSRPIESQGHLNNICSLLIDLQNLSLTQTQKCDYLNVMKSEFDLLLGSHVTAPAPNNQFFHAQLHDPCAENRDET